MGVAAVGKTTENRRELAIVLQPRFVMSDLMAIVGWLQAANNLLEAECFYWSICSQYGQPVIADNGMVLTALRDTDHVDKADQLLLLSGAHHARQPDSNGDRYVGIPKNLPPIPITILTPQHYQIDDLLPSFDISKVDVDDLMSALVLPELTPEQGEQLLAQRSVDEGQQRISDGRIHRALQLMRENLEIPLDSRELASRTYLSVRQLERLFRRYFDETPARYYTRIRLQSARRMLRSDEASVTDVALACGFGSVPHFCKLYRKRYGVTPGQDR